MSSDLAQRSRSIQGGRFWSLIRLPRCVTPAACLPSLDHGGLHEEQFNPTPQTDCTYFKPSRSRPTMGNWGVESCVSPSCPLTSARNYAACRPEA